jgi:hypothetical protein
MQMLVDLGQTWVNGQQRVALRQGTEASHPPGQQPEQEA